MSDDGATPDDEMSDQDSGPFCQHWGEPGSCDECVEESDVAAEYRARIAALEAEVTRLRQALEQAGATYENSGAVECAACGWFLDRCDAYAPEVDHASSFWCAGRIARRALASVTAETKELTK